MRPGGVSLAVDLERDFPDLVRAHQGAVYSVAYRLTGNAPDAEDAAQDTFIRAYRALRGYDAARREALIVLPWLASIAVNVCRNRARAISRRPQVSGSVMVDGAASDRSMDDVVGGQESALEIASALQRLPEPQRKAIVLHHAAGLTYPEVAAVLGRPAGTVKADVHRGLAALRVFLDPQEFIA